MNVNHNEHTITLTTGPQGPDGEITVYVMSSSPYPGEQGDTQNCVKRWQIELDAAEWMGDHWEAVSNITHHVSRRVLEDRYRTHPRKCDC